MSGRAGTRRPPVPSAPVSIPLRAAVLLTALASVVALGASGLLAPPTAVLFALLTCGAAVAPELLTCVEGDRSRKVLAVVVVGGSVVWSLAPHRGPDAAAAAGNLPWQLGPRLAVLAAGLLLAQLLLGERRRDLLVTLVVCGGLVVFALAVAPGPGVTAALALAWASGLTAAALARAGRLRAGADVIATVGVANVSLVNVSLATTGRVSARHPPRPDVRAGQLAVQVTVAALVGVLAVLLFPTPPGVQVGRGLAGGRPGQPGGEGADQTEESRDVAAYTHGNLDLRQRGDLPDQPVADVPVQSPVHWLGTTLTRYDGISWTADNAGVLLGPPLAGDPPYLLPPGPGDLGVGARSDRVQLRDGFTGVLLTPGHPVAVDVAAAVSPISGGWFLDAVDGQYPTAYEVTSEPTTHAPSVLRASAAFPRAPSAGEQALTDLPSSVPARVLDLGRRLTAGAASRYDAMMAVETYLRATFAYQLDSPVPPAGWDAVDHFLFEARAGFCEQFASAGVVLLRASGVPARLATGFAGGDVVDGRRTLRGTDAHAWVEVWYPGEGWVTSDPTAGSTLVESQPGVLDRVKKLMQDKRNRLLLALALVGLALVLGGVGFLVSRLVRRRRLRRAEAARWLRGTPLLSAFGRLEAALASVGRPRGSSESIGELAARPALAPVTGALAVLERSCYSPYEPDPAAEDEAARVLIAHAEAILADARSVSGSGNGPSEGSRQDGW